MKHLFYLTFVLSIFTQHTFSAEAAAPKPVDPLLWTPPATAPQPVERFAPDAFKAEVAKILPALEKKRKEFEPLPETSLLVTYVEKNSQAEIKDMHAGDFLLKLDGVLLTEPEQFNARRTETEQKLVTFTPGYGESTIDIRPGAIGARFQKWTKPRVEKFDLPADARWNQHIALAETLYPARLDLVETALCAAVKAGCPLNSKLQGLLAKCALNDRRYTDAMAFGWFAMKATPPDAPGAEAFLAAALASYKFEAALQAIQQSPVLSQHKSRVADLQRLIAKHKALPESERIRLSPLTQAPDLFWDPLIPRGKTTAGAREINERYIAWINQWHELTFDAIARETQNFAFGPEVQNLRIAFDVSVRGSDLSQGSLKYFAVGVLDMDAERAPHPDGLRDFFGQRWKADYKPSANGLVALQTAAVFRPGDIRICSWTEALQVGLAEGFASDPDEKYHFEMAIWNGQLEMALNGRRLFYAPLDGDKPHLAVTLSCSGLTASISDFFVSEIIDPKDVDSKIKPVLAEKLRGQTTRLHNAGAELPVPMVAKLLDLGADPNTRGLFEENPMHFTLKFRSDGNERDVVKSMLAKGGKPDLQIAAALANTSKIEELIKLDPKCVTNVQPWSPLLGPIRQGDTATLKLLLDKGADINAKSPANAGRTALITSVLRNQKEVFDLLLERGAKVNVGDNYQNTALFYAKKSSRFAAMEAELVKRKAEPKVAEPASVPVKPPAPPTGDF